MTIHPLLAAPGVLLFSAIAAFAAPVKVFILTGQSNMEGKGKVSLLEQQIDDPEIGELLPGVKKGGDWTVRDDVFIKFLDRAGGLTVGYGSPERIGPELAFGIAMGDHYQEPVVLIKTAWGGKSLYRDFRPPSSGLPDTAILEAILEKERKKKPETALDDVKESFGFYYRAMIADVSETIQNLGAPFPKLRGQKVELAGIVWFQGWNDMINPEYTAAYAGHMANFIRDVRKDLDAPGLPFVIGQLGVGGTADDGNAKKKTFKEAQAAPAALPEFHGNVALVKTDQFWDMDAEAIYTKGWKENFEAWEKVGSDRPYHYLGSVKCYSRIGKAFADALITMKQK